MAGDMKGIRLVNYDNTPKTLVDNIFVLSLNSFLLFNPNPNLTQAACIRVDGTFRREAIFPATVFTLRALTVLIRHHATLVPV